MSGFKQQLTGSSIFSGVLHPSCHSLTQNYTDINIMTNCRELKGKVLTILPYHFGQIFVPDISWKERVEF